MTQQDDQRLVDYLYDELSEEEAGTFERLLEEDTDLASEVSSLGETLGAVRALEDEDPPDWLSSKVMAEARQVAEAAEAEAEQKSLFGRLRKLMWGPLGGLVGAGAVAVVFAAIVTPQMVAERAARSPEQVAFDMAKREAAARPAAKSAPAAAQEVAEADSAADAKDGEGAARAALEQSAEAEPAPKAAPRPRRSAKRRSRRAAPPSSVAKAPAGGLPPEAPAAAPPPPEIRRAPAASSGAGFADDALASKNEAVDELRVGDLKGAEKKEEAAAPSDAQTLAAFLEAARSELARGDRDAARKVLDRAAARLARSPLRGEVFLVRAELELRAGVFSQAERFARLALGVPAFEGRDRARRLLERIRREQAPADLAPANEPP